MHLDFPDPLQEKTGHSTFSLLVWTNLDIYLICLHNRTMHITMDIISK